MKKLNLVVFAVIGILFMMPSCGKVIESRKTAYFYTKIDPADESISIFVNDKSIGSPNYVPDGINGFADRKEGLEYIFTEKENNIKFKNEEGIVVFDGSIEIKKQGRKVNMGTPTVTTGGNISLNMYQLGGTDNCI